MSKSLNNLAQTQAQSGDLTEAAATYDRVRAIDPDDANAALGAAHLDLLHGDFATGWAAREARWKVPGLPIVYPKFSQPMWLGQSSIAGKTILIYADEGMGDAIQLARYLPMVAGLGATVILVVHPALRPLLSGVAGVSLCIANNSAEAPPPFDTYCPMLSLPLAFATRLETIPAEDSVFAAARRESSGGVEQTASAARPVTGWPRVVRQPKTRRGPQALDPAGYA